MSKDLNDVLDKGIMKPIFLKSNTINSNQDDKLGPWSAKILTWGHVIVCTPTIILDTLLYFLLVASPCNLIILYYGQVVKITSQK